ncbi:hypothetical protein ACTFIW_006361 [Dictyostelium discoideum]
MREKEEYKNNDNNNNNNKQIDEQNKTPIKGYHISAKLTYFKLLEDYYFSKRNDWIKVNALTAPIGEDFQSTIDLCNQYSNENNIDKSKIPLLYTNLSIEHNEKTMAIRGPYFLDHSSIESSSSTTSSSSSSSTTSTSTTSTTSNNKLARIINNNSIIRNAIPNYQILTDKYLLYKHLFNSKSKYQVPTYFINRGKFENKLEISDNDNDDRIIWYLKDPLLNKSQGIKLFKSIENVLEFIEINENKNNRYLLQKEIHPKLLNGIFKFDIRIFLVITFTPNHTLVYLFKEGIVRSTNSPYKKGDITRDSQLTNFCYQLEINPDFQNILPLSQFEKNNNNNNENNNNENNKIFNKLKNATKDIFSSLLNRLNNQASGDKISGWSLFGLDFILDENENPFLLEINISPSTFQKSPNNVSSICQNLIKQVPIITFDIIFNQNNQNNHNNQNNQNQYKIIENEINIDGTDFIQIISKIKDPNFQDQNFLGCDLELF